MSPAHVLEPTYSRLKNELLSGRWPQDERLEAHRIADDYGVSMTPVRDCLNRLTGEGLVKALPGQGFHVSRITERGLRDMLGLNCTVLVAAVSIARDVEGSEVIADCGQHYADNVAALFRRIAQASGNGAFEFSVASLSDRLHFVRRIEATVVGGAEEDLAALAKKWHQSDPKLSVALASYHKARIERAAELVAALP